MAKTTPHPYVPSPGPLVQTFNQFKKGMPANVDAGTLKKLALAPNNEAVVLSVLRFLGLIDENGKRTEVATKLFSTHGTEAFQKALKEVVESAYSDLFELRGEEAWKLDRDALIGFFRATDETSALTGKRQAVAFDTLGALSGYGELNVRRPSGGKEKQQASQSTKTKTGKKTSAKSSNTEKQIFQADQSPIGLTVRIEINLPAQGDQETYDRIFASIKKNLLNG